MPAADDRYETQVKEAEAGVFKVDSRMQEELNLLKSTDFVGKSKAKLRKAMEVSSAQIAKDRKRLAEYSTA